MRWRLERSVPPSQLHKRDANAIKVTPIGLYNIIISASKTEERSSILNFPTGTNVLTLQTGRGGSFQCLMRSAPVCRWRSAFNTFIRHAVSQRRVQMAANEVIMCNTALGVGEESYVVIEEDLIASLQLIGN